MSDTTTGEAMEIPEEKLRKLAGRIGKALEEGRGTVFARLIKERSGILQQAFQATGARPSRAFIDTLIGQNRTWIDRARSVLADTRTRLDAAKTLSKTSKDLSVAYNQGPIANGRFISGNG